MGRGAICVDRVEVEKSAWIEVGFVGVAPTTIRGELTGVTLQSVVFSQLSSEEAEA